MSDVAEYVFCYLVGAYDKYVPLLENGHSEGHHEKVMNQIVGDLAREGIIASRLHVVAALSRLQKSGWVEPLSCHFSR